MTKRQSDLSGFRGWTNPDRFISEIEILVEELAAARADVERLKERIAELEQDRKQVIRASCPVCGGEDKYCNMCG